MSSWHWNKCWPSVVVSRQSGLGELALAAVGRGPSGREHVGGTFFTRLAALVIVLLVPLQTNAGWPPTELGGTYTVLLAHYDGDLWEPIPGQSRPDQIVIDSTRREICIKDRAGKLLLCASYQIDTSRRPARIDLMVIRQPVQLPPFAKVGERAMGCYNTAGTSVVSIYVSAPGSPRFTDWAKKGAKGLVLYLSKYPLV